ncbi:nucleolar protein 10-like [Centruroides sculpturatus]|uniref:nucleolar protein 10-like n=1 Tax=Centruroides sculpturatus TaxID=218467 RepID=UPI000C6CC39E|nr:nucleolar protein 10-like [Centruroides sculpturatus]
MQVSNPNNIKIYNLSCGKSLPDWISERKRRILQKKNVDIRRRIELIQDFEMPGISNCVKVSKDGQYVLVTGIYKPRIRCYDVNQLSMKFERCMDSEVVKFEILSDDYSKVVFLQDDRYIEFHVAYGRYYRIRIPKFGRDIAYHSPSCDLYCVGSGSEIYRLNLEQGQFLNSLQSDSSSINVCEVNPVHHLVVCGTKEILVYDIRSDKPFYVKDHMYGLPIKDIEFHKSQNLVISMDSKIVKLWDANNGKIFTSIQATTDLNDLCVVPDSGLIFLAHEERKVLTYYIPALGPAPKWCSFLDSLTEELEESGQDIVYDDYKFVSKKELGNLGLSHLIGTNLLRAYMHGYFIDMRLYHKAKSISEPFAYEEYRQKKIREKIEAERTNRVKIKKLPQINRELALKLQEEKEGGGSKKKKTGNILEDDRFKALFENVDYEINKECDEYKLLNPIVSKKDKLRKKKLQVQIEEEEEGRPSSEDDDSSDDDRDWIQEIKEQHRRLRQKTHEEKSHEGSTKPSQFYEFKSNEFKGFNYAYEDDKSKTSLDERLKQMENEEMIVSNNSVGNKTVTFTKKKSDKQVKREERNREHLEERKKLRRSAKALVKSTRTGKFH